MRGRAGAREGRRGGARDRPALLALLGAAGLLALGGFTAGVLAGVVLEDPRLLAAHLAGRSVDVDRVERVESTGFGSEGIGPETTGERATTRPDGAAPPPSPAAAKGRPGRGSRVDVAAPPPSAGLAVQVGAFAEPAAAESLAERLRARGLPVYVASGQGDPGPRWRVRVGPVVTRADAERLAGRLQREERLPTWILAEESR